MADARDLRFARWLGVLVCGSILAMTTSCDSCPFVAATAWAHWEVTPVATADCTIHHVEGVAVTGTAATADGVLLHLDLCPGAGRDCLCDLVVHTVGDISADLAPETDLVIDEAHPDPLISALAIHRAHTCDCVSCGCSEPLYLYSAYVDLGGGNVAPAVPEPYAFTRGATLCAENDQHGEIFLLHVRGPHGETDVAGRTTAELGPLRVRAFEDVHVNIGTSYSSGTTRANFVAWTSSR